MVAFAQTEPLYKCAVKQADRSTSTMKLFCPPYVHFALSGFRVLNTAIEKNMFLS